MKLCHVCPGPCSKELSTISNEKLQPVGEAIAGVIGLLTLQGLVCVDFQDLEIVLRGGGVATFGVGEAEGPDRAKVAAERAMSDLKQRLKLLKKAA